MSAYRSLIAVSVTNASVESEVGKPRIKVFFPSDANRAKKDSRASGGTCSRTSTADTQSKDWPFNSLENTLPVIRPWPDPAGISGSI